MRSLATGTVETCRRHGNGTVSVRLSVRLSVPSVDRCSSVRRVCCCGPGEREISIDCCTAGAQQQRRRILDFYRAVLACVCVCLSVRVSQVGVLLKRLNVGSHKQHHTIAQGI